MKAIRNITLLLFLCIIGIVPAWSQMREGALWISPVGGGYQFEGNQNIEGGPVVGLGLGYLLTQKIAAELMGKWGKFDTTYCNQNECCIKEEDFDGYLLHLDGLYHFNEDGSFVPYVAAGGGYIKLDHERIKDDTSPFLDYGAGFHYFLTKDLAFRADARHVHPFNESYDNFSWSLGLTYLIGGKDKNEQPDSDKDGVYDISDKCPNTPQGVAVNEDGCPLDSDKDGVFDYKDACPNTPFNFAVNEKGCLIDTDNDGVADVEDVCADTPFGMKVDKRGCPPDEDQDGIPDYKDICPKTSEGMIVDETGCPFDTDGDGVKDFQDACPDTPMGAKVNEKGCWIISNLVFETAKSDIKEVSYPDLNNIVDILKRNKDIKVEIQGHTDNVGKEEYNLKLSQRRATKVMEYLVQKGIQANRLKAVGYGLSQPATSNDTPEGQALNRRVQFKILK